MDRARAFPLDRTGRLLAVIPARLHCPAREESRTRDPSRASKRTREGDRNEAGRARPVLASRAAKFGLISIPARLRCALAPAICRPRQPLVMAGAYDAESRLPNSDAKAAI